MDAKNDYLEVNKALWNDKVDYHIDSEFYEMEAFLEGKSSLREVELPLLGDVKGKSILHLQCHFGQDSLSLARMGAKVTGVDISDKAIAKARELNEQLMLDASFVVSDVYELPSRLHANFDIIYTSYGVLGWLPDMERWARVIKHFMKPGGKLVLVEFHPVIWMFDEQMKEVAYRYFKSEPIIEQEEGTYAATDAPIAGKSISWNHSLSEVMAALMEVGLQIEHFKEYDFSPYNCFPNMKKEEEYIYRHKDLGNKIPMLYSISAHNLQ